MKHSLDYLRRQAKRLSTQVADGDASAVARAAAFVDMTGPLRHADYLHVIARETGYESWPKLKFAYEQAQMDLAQKADRLIVALHAGQDWVVQALLAEQPDLAHANIGIECALYDVRAVRARLAADPGAALAPVARRSPILHLAFSQHHRGQADPSAMIELAELLLAHGADLDDSFTPDGPGGSPLSALYGALGHARNMVLARWLLEHGANPDDNESLYHATELGHLDGLRLMLEFGATIPGTNALARMLDFNDPEGARLLLEAGADPNEGVRPHPSGQPSYALCALHHAARRRCSGAVAQILLDHGAEGRNLQFGHSAYALARMYGNAEIARVLEQAGQATDLTRSEAILARAAEGPGTERVSPDDLSPEQSRMLCRVLGFDDPLPHVKRLIEAGLDPNVTEEMGMPAIHIAGWEGQAQAVAHLLTLSPDLSHRNAYGGDLMGTILHGAGNCPAAPRRDHVTCAALALGGGMPLHRYDIDHCGHAELRDWLTDWAQQHPDRVV